MLNAAQKQMEEGFFLKSDIDFKATLESGQSFLWREEGSEAYSTCLLGGAFVRQEEGGLYIRPDDCPDSLEKWIEFFDIDGDYSCIIDLKEDAPLQAAYAYCPGLKLLRQPFFPTLCGFILSSNNNIKRITSLMGKLCELGDRGFPSALEIARAGEEALRRMGMGYRAKYINETARMVADGFDPSPLYAMEYEEVRNVLMRFPGVGGKVADCVMLFSLNHREAFPVDVWIARAMENWYAMTGSPEKVKRQAMERYGKNAGLVQTFLFHYARTGASFQ